MKYRNKLAGGQTIVVPACNCGIWVTKPITSRAEKITAINNNLFNALQPGNTEVSENVNKLIEFEQKQVKFLQKSGVKIRQDLIIWF